MRTPQPDKTGKAPGTDTEDRGRSMTPPPDKTGKARGRRPDFLFLFILAGAAVICWLELFPPVFSQDAVCNTLWKTLVTRLAGTVVFLPIAVRAGYRVYGFYPTGKVRGLRVSFPALLVVLNNLPWIGLLSGNAFLTRGGGVLLLYAAESLSIGLFEELAFRGVLLPAILEKRRDSVKSIFWATVVSSALFGAVHLLNLFAGGSPAGVLLQIGYSFLIGGMCAAVLLQTGCIWLCVLLHALFDFCGYLVPTLGDGIIWDPVTVVLTAVLGTAVLLHFLAVMRHTGPERIRPIFERGVTAGGSGASPEEKIPETSLRQ